MATTATSLSEIGSNLSSQGAWEAQFSDIGLPPEETVAAPHGAIDPAAYVPMVRAVARRLAATLPRHIELEDLISAGYLGLLDACEKFESGRQTQFRGYAEFRVRGAMLDSLRELDWGTRSLRRRGREMEKAKAELAVTLGRGPEDKELATKLGIELRELRQISTDLLSVQVSSLQEERGGDDDGGGQDLLSTLADPNAKDGLSLFLEAEFRQGLIDAIEALPERERLVISLSYYEELTLREIGEMLGVTESRVSQMRSSAISRLRKVLAGK